MASVALRAQFSLMLIIFLMAGNTGGLRPHFLIHRRCMAVIAVQLLVPTIKFKSSSFVVVEVPNFPVTRVVTVLTE